MKRLFDIVFSASALLLLSPILLVASILVYFKLGSPIFFRQKRVGLDNATFEVVKFRSMLDARCKNGELLSDEKRLTPFGKLLRASSIDELPGLWNVLRGDMSLVGPRPQDAKFLALYTDRQIRRHDVKPGITGWAQVNGRNSIGWEERFELDVWYVENQSFWLDIKICLMTIPVVLLRKGISADGHVSMPAFKGSVNLRSQIQAAE